MGNPWNVSSFDFFPSKVYSFHCYLSTVSYAPSLVDRLGMCAAFSLPSPFISGLTGRERPRDPNILTPCNGPGHCVGVVSSLIKARFALVLLSKHGQW
jgi:hypothetical protein